MQICCRCSKEKKSQFIGLAPIRQLSMCIMIIVNIQGRSPNVQILSFKRSSHFEKGRNLR